jgi:hypothetical protein
MQKNLLLIPLIALTLFIKDVSAASPSPSPSPIVSPSPSDDVVKENLKNRFKDSITGGVDEGLDSLASKRAYIGVVKDVIKDTVIIEDKDGKKDIKLGDNTVILRSPGNTTIKAENIRIEDYVIAIGTPRSEEVLDASRLIVSTSAIDTPPKTSGIGELKKISKTQLTLSIEGSDKVLTFNVKTIFKSPVATIDLADLAIGDTLVYTATKDDKDALTTTVVMRIKTAAIEE